MGLRLPARSVMLARAVERLVSRCGLTPVLRGRSLVAAARFGFERRHPELWATAADATMNGVQLAAPGEVWRAYLERRFDPLSTARLRRFLRPGMCVVDVGAHLGYYTLLAAARVGARGKVHAFEPCPLNLQLLRSNVARFGKGRVVLHEMAAGPAPATRCFRVARAADMSGFYANPLTDTCDIVEVEQARVDDVVDSRVDMVKIDVEGAELEVLPGMTGIVDGSPALRLLVEWNPACLRAAGREPGDLLTWLLDRGFAVEGLDEDRQGVIPLERLQSLARSTTLAPEWFCNLWAYRPGS